MGDDNCRYCGRSGDIRGLATHERVCVSTKETIDVVLWAMERGEPPGIVVADRLGISHSAARMRITRLKKAGLLDVDCRQWNSGRGISHGTSSGYCHHECRCGKCRAWNAGRARKKRPAHRDRPQRERPVRVPRPRYLCTCDECGFSSETATTMYAHCLGVHDRKLTNAERTPRAA